MCVRARAFCVLQCARLSFRTCHLLVWVEGWGTRDLLCSSKVFSECPGGTTLEMCHIKGKILPNLKMSLSSKISAVSTTDSPKFNYYSFGCMWHFAGAAGGRIIAVVNGDVTHRTVQYGWFPQVQEKWKEETDVKKKKKKGNLLFTKPSSSRKKIRCSVNSSLLVLVNDLQLGNKPLHRHTDSNLRSTLFLHLP